MSEFKGIRGRLWFKALTGQETPMPGDPHSVLVADAPIGDENARFLCVVPDPDSRFPCARHGEVGLEQAYTLAARIREVMKADNERPSEKSKKRPIIAIVDVKSKLTAGAKKSPVFISLPRPRPTLTPPLGSQVTR
jgi:malonate decarboxylase gamma subunit